MRHYLQSPLLHGTLKPVATQQYFTKSQNHFHKAQILIWHLFLQSSNNNLALFYKAQILIWHLFLQSPNANLALFYKAQILIWHYFIMPKYYFDNSFIKPKVLIWQLSLHYFYKSPNTNLTSILQSPKPF